VTLTTGTHVQAKIYGSHFIGSFWACNVFFRILYTILQA
jgi:hypothetical protein